jgi:hypothetical protein
VDGAAIVGVGRGRGWWAAAVPEFLKRRVAAMYRVRWQQTEGSWQVEVNGRHAEQETTARLLIHGEVRWRSTLPVPWSRPGRDDLMPRHRHAKRSQEWRSSLATEELESGLSDGPTNEGGYAMIRQTYLLVNSFTFTCEGG